MKRKWFKRHKAKTVPTTPPKANLAPPKAKKIPIGTQIDLATRYLRTWVQRLVKLLPPLALLLGFVYIIDFTITNWHKTVLIDPHVDPNIGVSHDAVSLQSELLTNINDMPTRDQLIKDILSVNTSFNPILEPDIVVNKGFLDKETITAVKNTISNDASFSPTGKVAIAGIDFEALPIIRRFQRLLLGQDFGHLEVYKQADSGITVASVTTDNGLVWRVSEGTMGCAVVDQSLCLGVMPTQHRLGALLGVLAYKMAILPNGDESTHPDWVSQAYFREALRFLDLGVRGIDRKLVELAQRSFEIALKSKFLSPKTKFSTILLELLCINILQTQKFRQYLTKDTDNCELVASTFAGYQNETKEPNYRNGNNKKYNDGIKKANQFYDFLIDQVNKLMNKFKNINEFKGNFEEQKLQQLKTSILIVELNLTHIIIDQNCTFLNNTNKYLIQLSNVLEFLKMHKSEFFEVKGFADYTQFIPVLRTLIGKALLTEFINTQQPKISEKIFRQIQIALKSPEITLNTRFRAYSVLIRLHMILNNLEGVKKNTKLANEINGLSLLQQDSLATIKHSIWVRFGKGNNDEHLAFCLWNQAKEAISTLLKNDELFSQTWKRQHLNLLESLKKDEPKLSTKPCK